MAATPRAVNLTDVSEGGSFKPRRKPEGDYRAKIVKADDHVKDGKTPGWVMTVQIEGDARSTYPVYLNPDPKQAWKIWQACRAVGLNVKKAKVRFDPNKLVGKELGVFLEDDEYEGRPKSVIGEMFPVSEVGGNADEDEEEIVDEVDLGDEDEEEEEEPEPEPVKPTKRVVRKRQPEPKPEEEDEDEEEDEEEPPPPPRKRVAKKAAAPAPTRRRKPAPEPEEDEEDEDLDLDDLDDE